MKTPSLMQLASLTKKHVRALLAFSLLSLITGFTVAPGARALLAALFPHALLASASAAAPLVAAVPAAATLPGVPEAEISVESISNAITELDVLRAQRYFTALGNSAGGDGLSFQRARLAIYVGDCDSAEAILRSAPATPDLNRLADLAKECARATAGALVVEDRDQGVWVRLQDSADAPLVPYLVDVAVRARELMRVELGVALPRPLRIDVVRDLFSLAAVSGLPLEAAETTGTVAIARWGRVILLSPHATSAGYPWQDTLAHEITHLALARGSRDFAPLWLQEGIAKREEMRWRTARPFDGQRNPHEIARDALLSGNSVGVDAIGPSIAMLPTPEAAAISYAEVESFMDYWINSNGTGALSLLLLDLKGQGSRETDAALLSVTGYPLRYWIARWQRHLLELPPTPHIASTQKSEGGVVQDVRLGDLCMKLGAAQEDGAAQEHGASLAAAHYFGNALLKAPSRAPVRFRAAGAELVLHGEVAARTALGELTQVSGLFGAWLGLEARLLAAENRAAEAETAWNLALSVDPFGEEAACGGYTPALPARAVAANEALPLPQDATRRKLCEAVRAARRD